MVKVNEAPSPADDDPCRLILPMFSTVTVDIPLAVIAAVCVPTAIGLLPETLVAASILTEPAINVAVVNGSRCPIEPLPAALELDIKEMFPAEMVAPDPRVIAPLSVKESGAVDKEKVEALPAVEGPPIVTLPTL